MIGSEDSTYLDRLSEYQPFPIKALLFQLKIIISWTLTNLQQRRNHKTFDLYYFTSLLLLQFFKQTSKDTVAVLSLLESYEKSENYKLLLNISSNLNIKSTNIRFHVFRKCSLIAKRFL